MEMGKQEMTLARSPKNGWLLEEMSHEGMFGRAFMLLTWNLMCKGLNKCLYFLEASYLEG